MIYVAAALVLVLLAGTVGVILVLRDGLDRVADQLRREDPKGLSERLDRVEWLMDELPQKWEEMVKASKRSEDRARAVVRRAKEELEEAGYEHEGVEAEAAQLRVFDGGRGPAGGVQQVREGVEGGETPPAEPVEDWEEMTRARKYGGAG